MKSKKYIGRDKMWFCYKDYKTNTFYGLLNDILENGIGYHYKDIKKGFWLNHYKK